MASGFGTSLAPTMALAALGPQGQEAHRLQDVGPLPVHPAAHGLHYGSVCFEGLKAHRGADGRVRLFRADAHVARLRRSAELMHLPVPDAQATLTMLAEVVAANLEQVPDPPGALYLRPVLMGVDENIGAAGVPSQQALLYVLASPVGDYFAGGGRPLRLLVETELARTAAHFGRVKAGANYAMALDPILRAHREHDVDQVLFAAGGLVTETGAANVLVLDDERVVTPPADDALLHGVTRDSVLTLAADDGYAVEERPLKVPELLELAAGAEVALSGTAAVLAGVGELLHDGAAHAVGTGRRQRTTAMLRERLVAVQRGLAADDHGWTRPVED